MAQGLRTLGADHLNRALLARQGLLERGRGSLPKTLERIAGIQAQYAPSMYVGLWSRLAGFERQTLTGSLEHRTVVQGTSLRATIHLLSPSQWWAFAIAIRRERRERRERWLRYLPDGPNAREMAVAARRVAPRLREAPLRRAEIQELVGKGARGVNGLSLWLELVRVPPSGTWERRRADLFGLAEEWIGPAPQLDERQAREELVRSYLRGFGPASVDEIASWAGLGIRDVRNALGEVELRRFAAEDGTELLDLPRLPLPDPRTPAPVRFLPTWDATLLVHARRSQILPEEHRPRVFSTKTPQSVPTFLVDGRVAGTWRFEDGRIQTHPFGRLDAAARREVDEEAERLAGFHR